MSTVFFCHPFFTLMKSVVCDNSKPKFGSEPIKLIEKQKLDYHHPTTACLPAAQVLLSVFSSPSFYTALIYVKLTFSLDEVVS